MQCFACSFPVDQCFLICCWGRARSWGRTAWGCLGTCHGANRSAMLSWNREVSSQQCHTQWTYYIVCTVCSWYCLKRGPHQCIACTLTYIHTHLSIHMCIPVHMCIYTDITVHTYVLWGLYKKLCNFRWRYNLVQSWQIKWYLLVLCTSL